ncbi:MAG TPA: sigma 54-interacting transcriptional regulator [Candidatus Sulfotelmatobacter sp.]|nr:sigma 54-interacting transcriptional regulator [Candidatus Sulfotelmatobacter sp.]
MPDRLRPVGEDSVPQQEPRVFGDLSALCSAPAAVCILDSEQRYFWLNHEFAGLNGLPVSELLGKRVREVVGGLAEQIEPYVAEVLCSGEPILNVEVSTEHPFRKTRVHWQMHFFALRQQEGKFGRVGIVINEHTNGKEKNLEGIVESLGGKLQQEMGRLQSLTEINALLSSNRDVPLLFPWISAHIRRVMRQEMASLALLDAGNRTLVGKALDFPLSRGLLTQSPVSLKDNPAEKALDSGAPVIFCKQELQAFESPIALSLLAEGIQSLCCVPIMSPTGPLGLFMVGSTRKDAFQQNDLALLIQVASQLALAMENHLAASEIRHLKKRLGEERKFLEEEVEPDGPFSEIIGGSPALRQVLRQVGTVASSGATVLILGETGTGKELIARAIHRLSRRKDAPFIKVNCAAIPTGLLESELFGHEKGAFTGAISRKVGRMELADGGTLFLDEVGEIPLDLQPKLLRALQDQEFEHLGSNHTVKVNVRLIAATNRNLPERVACNEFRSDLYYRLSVFPITVPPLRERKEDIPLLVRYFVRQFSQRMDRHVESVPQSTMDALLHWQWPGNVRELENLMERSVILSEGSVLRVPLSELRPPAETKGSPAVASDDSLHQAERQHILRVLREAHGKLSGPNGAAKRLGLKRTTLQSQMQRLKIFHHDYSDSQPD